ncbi:MAG: hypothetical protein K6G29_07825 [Clostridiales bacterium]|nr:hypothetical protein [Clostridiales bacterium]
MNQDRPVKPSADERMLDGLLTLAVREEMEEEDAEPMPDIEVPESLDRRMRRKIVLHRIRDGFARHVRGIAAVFIAALAITVAVLAAQRADADMPLYVLTSEPDYYGWNLHVSFTASEEVHVEAVRPKSPAALLGMEPEVAYRADAAYLEEYPDGTRYEQSALAAGGVTVIPVRGRTVKNIVIGGRAAILAFDETSASILWQDGQCACYLTGPHTSDEVMRIARAMCGGEDAE